LTPAEKKSNGVKIANNSGGVSGPFRSRNYGRLISGINCIGSGQRHGDSMKVRKG